MSFANKVVLITGASSGIGAETALQFAALEALLVITGRNSDNLEKVAVSCEQASPSHLKPLAIIADVGVRVNAVNPGVITTGIHKRGGMEEDQYALFLEKCKETHAIQRPGEPKEVASVIIFLAGEGASNITGVTLPVDGGRHAMCPR